MTVRRIGPPKRPGAKKSAAGLFCDEHGITTAHLNRIGGLERVLRMAPDARALLLKPAPTGLGEAIRARTLTERGMPQSRPNNFYRNGGGRDA